MSKSAWGGGGGGGGAVEGGGGSCPPCPPFSYTTVISAAFEHIACCVYGEMYSLYGP